MVNWDWLVLGVLCNNEGGVLMMFSKSIGIKDSNEAEVLAILETFCMFVCVHNSKLIVESYSSDAIYWVLGF